MENNTSSKIIWPIILWLPCITFGQIFFVQNILVRGQLGPVRFCPKDFCPNSFSPHTICSHAIFIQMIFIPKFLFFPIYVWFKWYLSIVFWYMYHFVPCIFCSSSCFLLSVLVPFTMFNFGPIYFCPLELCCITLYKLIQCSQMWKFNLLLYINFLFGAHLYITSYYILKYQTRGVGGWCKG